MTRAEIMREAKEEGGMFIVIPSVVALDAELPLSAQMLYGIIGWKCNKRAYTWATNRELGEALGVSPKRVSALLSLLEERGHIETEVEYKENTHEVLRRYTYPIMKSARSMRKGGTPPENEDTPPPKNEDTPPPETRDTLPPGMSISPPENAEVICNKKENKKYTPYSPPEGDAPSESGDCRSAPPNDGPTEQPPQQSSDGAVIHPSGEQPARQPAAAQDKPGRKTGRERFVPPDVEQVRAYCRERGKSIDPEAFVDYYASKGWVVGKSPMKDWRAAVRTWERRRAAERKESDDEDDWFR